MQQSPVASRCDEQTNQGRRRCVGHTFVAEALWSADLWHKAAAGFWALPALHPSNVANMHVLQPSNAAPTYCEACMRDGNGDNMRDSLGFSDSYRVPFRVMVTITY